MTRRSISALYPNNQTQRSPLQGQALQAGQKGLAGPVKALEQGPERD
jgi:hypothetical protein